MCFNALISTTDDHPRNHAVIAFEDAWKLSPAYDLLPGMPVSLERRDLALECGDMGRYAHATNLLSQSARFLLEPEEAKAIVDEMEQIIKKRWHEISRRVGVTEKDCEAIRSAFVYEGFRLPIG
jgi:serine/threonine-protein kinase HipA